MAKVTYICKRTVVSTKPVQPGKSHQLSVLDRLVEPDRHVMVVYYYHTDRSIAAIGEVTEKLRESLAEVLTYFPAVTGRLHRVESQGSGSKSGWEVRCNDAGVRMVEARAKGSVEGWLRNVDWEKEKKLIHWEEVYHKPYFWSTFYFQLTEFEEGGFAIGLSCSHLLSDPICAAMLVKTWADITLRGKMICPPLFHQLPAHRPGTRSSIPDPFADLCGHCLTSATQPGTTPTQSVHNKRKTISLSFSDQMVMEMARGHAGGPSQSPFEAVAGLIWSCISRVRGLTNGLVGLTMGLDVRKMLGLDDGFFGNCMVYSHIQPRHEENTIAAAAKAIREKMAKFENEKVKDLIEWLEHNDGSRPIQEMLTCSDLLCVNLESVDPRCAVFEDRSSSLIQTSVYLEPACNKGQFLILPSLTGGFPSSRVVMITLPEDEADKLCKDDMIRRFAPTVLMGGRVGRP